MLEKIEPNSPQAWRIYFIAIFIFWVVIPFILFIACLPDKVIGAIVVTAYTAFFIGGAMYKIDKDMKAKLSGTDVGYMSVIKLAGKIILILKSGSGLIFPVLGILELEIYSIRERNQPLKLEGIETADSAQVDWAKFGLKREDFDDLDLNSQMKINLEFNLFWYPKEDQFENYLTNIANYGGNEDEVDKKFSELVPDVAKNILLAEANQRTPALINFQRENINMILKEKMQEEISYKDEPKKSWGINIQRMQLSRLSFPDAVVVKMEEKVLFNIDQYMKLKNAKTDSEIIKAIAKAKEFEEVYLGRGKAKAEMFMLKTKAVGERLITAAHGLGKAKGYGALSKALNMNEPELLVKLETMENTFKNIEKVWFPGSDALSGLFGLLPMLGDAIKQAGVSGSKQ